MVERIDPGGKDPLLPTDGSRADGPASLPWVSDPWDDPKVVSESEVEDSRTGGVLDPESRPTVRGLVRTVAWAVVAVVLLAGLAGWWVVRELNPGGNAETVTFTVNADDDLGAVIDRLADQDLIGNSAIFSWYVRSRGGLEPAAGYYRIERGASAGDIVAVLATPPSDTFVNVTFPEGFTIEQMARRLSEKVPNLDAERFVMAATDGSVISALAPGGTGTLEGLLFPDTYQVAGDSTESEVVARLASTMESVASKQVDLAGGAKLLGRTQYEVLIVASMIEKEAKVAADRPKIARVIYNRLEAGMKLQIDATVKYVSDPALPWTDQKATDSKFNSYLHAGLPPTPIANPGRASIAAALAPAPPPKPDDEACVGLPRGTKCDYFFYVLIDEDGRHRFATTLTQHEANTAEAIASGVLR
ncbi:MAG: endolytic transglycosylase MltG [Actinobacteria bacterium]|nr:endolytic transglycosylase MltG [Actinomycetota bacterium]